MTYFTSRWKNFLLLPIAGAMVGVASPPAAANGYPIWQYEITMPPNSTDGGEFPAPKAYVSQAGDWNQLGEVLLEEDRTLERLVRIMPEGETKSTDIPSSAKWRTLLVRLEHMTPGFFVFKDWCPSEITLLYHGPNNGYPEISDDGRSMIIVIGADDNGSDHDFNDATIYLTYDNNEFGWAEIKPIYTTYKGCNPFGG